MGAGQVVVQSCSAGKSKAPSSRRTPMRLLVFWKSSWRVFAESKVFAASEVFASSSSECCGLTQLWISQGLTEHQGFTGKRKSLLSQHNPG